MLKVTIKTRGKVFKLPDGETIRCPRIFYRPASMKSTLMFQFKNLAIPAGDCTFEEIPDDQVPAKVEPVNLQRHTRIRNDRPEISVGGKIGKK